MTENSQPTDTELLDWVQKKRFNILACHQPRTFMITVMGQPGGMSPDLRQAIKDAMQLNPENPVNPVSGKNPPRGSCESEI